MRLSRNFFQQKTLKVAKELLGCFLIRQIGRRRIVARIIETEAYCGPNDLANHASKGLTPRTKIMFGPAAHAYVYLIYGMYYCFNVVTEKKGYPAAVLIRGVEIRDAKIIGPGKVCREMKIDKCLNGIDLLKSDKLQIVRLAERFNPPPVKRIKKFPRVGVDYAGEYKDKKWRFVLINPVRDLSNGINKKGKVL